MDFASSIINSTSDAVIAINLDGEITLWNKGAIAYYGYTNEEALGKNISMVYRKEDLPLLGKRIKKVIRGENISDAEVIIIDKSKNERTVLLSINGLKDKKGKVYQMVGFTKDITELKKVQRTLFESERRLKLLYKNAELAVSYYSKDGIAIDHNEISLKWLNKKKSEVVGKSLQETFPNIFERIQERINFCVKSKQTQQHEGSIEIKGNIRWFLNVYSPSINENGNIIGVQILTLDLTDKKLAETKLSRSNQLLEASQEVAKVGGWELDIISNELFWTKETYNIHDTSSEEFNPTVDAGVSYFLPESRQIITEALKLAIEQGEGYDLELETYTAKGRLINVRTTCVVTLNKGKPSKLTGIFQDITKQKQVELEIIKAKENAEELSAKFEILSKVTFEGIVIHDSDVTVDFNISATAMFGYTRDEFIDKDLIKLIIHKDYHNTVIENIKNEYEHPYKAIGIKKDRTEFPIEIEGKS